MRIIRVEGTRNRVLRFHEWMNENGLAVTDPRRRPGPRRQPRRAALWSVFCFLDPSVGHSIKQFGLAVTQSG